MQDQDKYKDFSVTDFICDKYFQEWIIRPDEEKNDFWKIWIAEHPEREGFISTAKNLLANIAFIEQFPSEALVQNSLASALAEIESSEKSKPAVIIRNVNRLWRAAAILIMIIGVGAVVFFYNRGTSNIKQVATKYGVIDSIVLPDNSKVVLNAHSKIRYKKEWNKNEPREIWLNGEALFIVKHLNTNTNSIKQEDRFIVHTDLAKIEVLGTVFNVRERRGKTEIVLQQGKIKVSFTKSKEPYIIMQPGQIVTIAPEEKKVVTSTIKPEEYTAWTKKKLILNDASFEEIVEYMEDNFGKHIILSDPQLANRKVEGTFKIDNLDDAVLVLSKALNVEIVQKDETWIVTPK